MPDTHEKIEQEPRPRFVIREAVAQEVIPARAMQAEAWNVTYPNEAEGVSEEWVRGRTDKWRSSRRLEQSIEILSAILKDPTQFYRIAEQEGEIVGFIHLTTKEDNTKRLEAIYTSPKTFGTGLGAGLMEAAEPWIGDSTVTLEVARYNQRALGFYEKHGFRVIEGSDHLYADTIPVIDMIREGEPHEV